MITPRRLYEIASDSYPGTASADPCRQCGESRTKMHGAVDRRPDRRVAENIGATYFRVEASIGFVTCCARSLYRLSEEMFSDDHTREVGRYYRATYYYDTGSADLERRGITICRTEDLSARDGLAALIVKRRYAEFRHVVLRQEFGICISGSGENLEIDDLARNYGLNIPVLESPVRMTAICVQERHKRVILAGAHRIDLSTDRVCWVDLNDDSLLHSTYRLGVECNLDETATRLGLVPRGMLAYLSSLADLHGAGSISSRALQPMSKYDEYRNVVAMRGD